MTRSKCVESVMRGKVHDILKLMVNAGLVSPVDKIDPIDTAYFEGNPDIPVIDANSVLDYFVGNALDGEIWDFNKDFVNLAPPFETFFLSFDRADGVEVALLVMADTAEDAKVDIPGARWRVLSLAYGYEGGVTAGPTDLCSFVVGNDGGSLKCQRTSFMNSLHVAAEKLGYPEADKLKPTTIGGLSEDNYYCFLSATVLALTLTFMNCKNVELRQEEVSPKLLKKRKKRGLPIYKTYTLNITPIKRALSSEGNIETAGIKQAMHICRGHFKDFRDTKGLFGRHKGVYWWNQQMRGSADEGVVEKDYKVVVTKQEEVVNVR